MQQDGVAVGAEEASKLRVLKRLVKILYGFLEIKSLV